MWFVWLKQSIVANVYGDLMYVMFFLLCGYSMYVPIYFHVNW
jgi:hypothetical protein